VRMPAFPVLSRFNVPDDLRGLDSLAVAARARREFYESVFSGAEAEMAKPEADRKPVGFQLVCGDRVLELIVFDPVAGFIHQLG